MTTMYLTIAIKLKVLRGWIWRWPYFVSMRLLSSSSLSFSYKILSFSYKILVFIFFFLNSLSISVCMPGLLQWKPWLPSIISCCFYCLIFSFITTENNVIIIINSIHLLNMIQFSQQRLLQYMYKIRSFVFYLQCFNNSTINVSQGQKLPLTVYRLIDQMFTQMMSSPRTGYSNLCEAMTSFVTVHADSKWTNIS